MDRENIIGSAESTYQHEEVIRRGEKQRRNYRIRQNNASNCQKLDRREKKRQSDRARRAAETNEMRQHRLEKRKRRKLSYRVSKTIEELAVQIETTNQRNSLKRSHEIEQQQVPPASTIQTSCCFARSRQRIVTMQKSDGGSSVLRCAACYGRNSKLSGSEGGCGGLAIRWFHPKCVPH